MKKYFFITAGLLFLSFSQLFAQKRKQSVRISDFDINAYAGFTFGNYSRFILNADADYFIQDNLAANAGFQIWGGTANLTVGAKYYLDPSWYLRARALFLGEVDFSAGTGYRIPLDDRLTLNLATDYYFDAGSLGLVGGVSFRF
ncbi:MAG: hypothetical protein MI784_00235 [Cytophagales bacterium]|nr:hypothetical protein [Cytophagales bacterium]